MGSRSRRRRLNAARGIRFHHVRVARRQLFRPIDDAIVAAVDVQRCCVRIVGSRRFGCCIDGVLALCSQSFRDVIRPGAQQKFGVGGRRAAGVDQFEARLFLQAKLRSRMWKRLTLMVECHQERGSYAYPGQIVAVIEVHLQPARCVVLMLTRERKIRCRRRGRRSVRSADGTRLEGRIRDGPCERRNLIDTLLQSQHLLLEMLRVLLLMRCDATVSERSGCGGAVVGDVGAAATGRGAAAAAAAGSDRKATGGAAAALAATRRCCRRCGGRCCVLRNEWEFVLVM